MDRKYKSGICVAQAVHEGHRLVAESRWVDVSIAPDRVYKLADYPILATTNISMSTEKVIGILVRM